MAGEFFKYRNPIYSGAFEAIRDCQIIRHAGVYYLTGTCPPFWQGENAGIRLFSSMDLLDWKAEALLIERDLLSRDAWYRDCFWAPEIHKLRGRFYLTFNCRNEPTGFPHSCGVATAAAILGPYTVRTSDAPLVTGANDLTLFEDSDGRAYAFYSVSGLKNWHSIMVCEIDLETCALVGTPCVCLERCPGNWDGIGIEGPYVIKRNGIYYLFYSSWTRGYEIGYATAGRPQGPWTKAANNPIFGAQDEEACRRSGVEFTGRRDCPFVAVGHNAIFTGPDDRDWIVCHYQEKNRRESLGFDPIWLEEGVIRTEGPTFTPQRVVLHPQ